ncbi:MAG TPA: 30S ribosomal protein S12 methylthiotransferase RimO [Verrucomicrobia bacterium]|nr:MAG: ribosomal protein S12 methylthiotransferase RimO [Lentisphaerae bacterium GWF2_57_35]HBA85323.1 30S ribosomal protein S12 methylthiotransferase RimO [Verrucomicrobiota bacterium]
MKNKKKSVRPRPAIVSLVSLGCAKNQVDSECVLGQLVQRGFAIAEDPAEADLCLVNTCGFIHEARQEAAEVLKELRALKRKGRPCKIVAMGCLVERVSGSSELDCFLKEADARIGFKEYGRLPDICEALLDAAFDAGLSSPGKTRSYSDFLNSARLRIGSAHSAYLKLSEGCSNPCRFCSIPMIRGRQISRPMEQIVREARQLIDSGARELVLIAQDTTSYGQDLYGKRCLPELLNNLLKWPDDVWFRLMYAYPGHLTDEILDVLAAEPRFCPYIDIPLQHIADDILKSMGRVTGKKATLDLLDRIAAKLPLGAVRTAFIVGYPGETDAHFQELLDFVREGRFSHAGVFIYSPEPGTRSAELKAGAAPEEAQLRRDLLMEAQREASRERLKKRVGQTVELIIDGRLAEDGSGPILKGFVARSQLEAPEVDGVIFLGEKGFAREQPGNRVMARIKGALDYDLIAEKADIFL